MLDVWEVSVMDWKEIAEKMKEFKESNRIIGISRTTLWRRKKELEEWKRKTEICFSTWNQKVGVYGKLPRSGGFSYF